MGFANSLKLGEAFKNYHHLKVLMSLCLYVQVHSINHSHRQKRTVVFKQDLPRVVGQFGRWVFVAGAEYIVAKVKVWLSLHPIPAVHLSHPSDSPVCNWHCQAPGTSVNLGTFCARAEVKMLVWTQPLQSKSCPSSSCPCLSFLN